MELVAVSPLLLFLFVGPSVAFWPGAVLAMAQTATPPSGVLVYVPITNTNTQFVATPSPFQQIVNVTSSNPLWSYINTTSGYVASNVVFFYANGTVIPSWLESYNSSHNPSYMLFWINLKGGIPASSSVTIYMGVGSLTTNYYSIYQGTVGEAPELSPTYGQYDSGANVFLFYDNFAGTSLNTNKWVTNGLTSGYTVNNGLTYDPDTNYNQLDTAVSFSAPYVIDYYGKAGNSDSGFFFNIAYQEANSSSRWGWYQRPNTYYDQIAEIVNGSTVYGPTWGPGSYDGNMHVYTLELGPSDNPQTMLIDYSKPVRFNNAPSTITSGYFGPRLFSGTPLFWQWVRVRAYPPNGVMPSVSFGTPVAPGTVTININPAGGASALSTANYFVISYTNFTTGQPGTVDYTGTAITLKGIGQFSIAATSSASTSSERWALTGGAVTVTITTPGTYTYNYTYYQQYAITASVSYPTGGSPPWPPTLSYTSLGQRFVITLSTISTNVWVDAGSTYKYTTEISAPGGRYAAPHSYSGLGIASSATVLSIPYYLHYNSVYILEHYGSFAIILIILVAILLRLVRSGYLNSALLFVRRRSGSIIATMLYGALTVYFLSGLLMQRGSLPQQNWNIPLTSQAALQYLYDSWHAWVFSGYGNPAVGAAGLYGVPLFQFIDAVLSLLGLTGGSMIKFWAFTFTFLSGILAFLLARDSGLSYTASFFGGLLYMTSPPFFDRLMNGGPAYLTAYSLLPLFALLVGRAFRAATKERLIYYSLASGLIINLVIANPSFLIPYFLAALFVLVLPDEATWRRRLRNGILASLIAAATLVPFILVNLYSLNFSPSGIAFFAGQFVQGGAGAMFWQYIFSSQFANVIRLWGSAFNFNFESFYFEALMPFSFAGVILAAIAPVVIDARKKTFATVYLAMYAVSVGLIYGIYAHYPYVLSLPILGALLLNLVVIFYAASLGLSMAVAASAEGMIRVLGNRKRLLRLTAIGFILAMVLMAGLPFFALQASGEPSPNTLAVNAFSAWNTPVPATKLNLAPVPASYYFWPEVVNASNQYFTLYWPPISRGVGHIWLNYDPLFNSTWRGADILVGPVNVFNGLPYVAAPFPKPIADVIGNLTSGRNANYSEELGIYGIKYIVIYLNTSVSSGQQWYSLYNSLRGQPGFTQVDLPGLVIFVNDHAEPILHTDSGMAHISDISVGVASFRAQVTAETPYMLVLDQYYDPGFVLYVGGKAVPASSHLIADTMFNGWIVNATGTYNVDVMYEPDGGFIALESAYTIFLLGLIAYLVVGAAGKCFLKNLTWGNGRSRERLPP
jgi:hypothetical protein